ncbi:MAG: PAS domain S-box protein [candidate division FCPU426 bacterium]
MTGEIGFQLTDATHFTVLGRTGSAESIDAFELLWQHLTHRIFLKNSNLEYVSCNQAFAEDLGVELPSQIKGKTDFDFFPTELAEKYRGDDLRIMAAGHPEELEEPYLIRGRMSLVHTMKIPIRDGKTGFVGLLGIFGDITEKKKLEAELRFKDAAVRSAINAIMLVDLDGNIMYANPAFCRMWGYADAEEVVGRPVEDFGFNKYMRVQISGLLPKLSEGWSGKVQILKKDGSSLALQMSIGLVVEKERVIGLLCSAVDITFQEHLQQQFKEYAGREQKRLASYLHDEIGQDLAGILLLGSALEKNLKSRNRGEAKVAELIKEQAQQCIAKTRELIRQTYPLHAVCEGLPATLADLCRSVSQKSGVVCRYSGGREQPCIPHSSTLELYFIAKEAVHNALKHGQPASIEIRTCQQDDVFQMEIEDDGRGMPSSPGQGLGIHIMQYRAELLGGCLEVCGRNNGPGVVVRCLIPIKHLSEKPR